MGDAQDSGVVILLFPGVLVPVIFLMTLAVSKVRCGTVPTLSTKRILIASAFESAGPTLALVISGIFLMAAHTHSLQPTAPRDSAFKIALRKFAWRLVQMCA